MTSSRRLFSYTMAFAGLLTALYAITSLLALAAATLTLGSNTLLGAEDLRSRASFYLAALIVGLPLWLGFWLAAQRRLARSPEERNARERRLFLGAVFATTSVVVLFGLHTLLQVLLTLPGPPALQLSALDGIAAGARLLVYAAAWVVYARIGWSERSAGDEDEFHDVAACVLAGFALTFLAIGVGEALRQLVGDLLGAAQPTLLAERPGSLWTIWGAIAAWILSGGAVWAAIWQYDLARGGRRDQRVVYLYIVLLVAVPVTLGGAVQGLNELLRRIFGYREMPPNWSFLEDVLPLVLVGGMLWVYHWHVMRRQAALDTTAAPDRAGGIAWPRRPGLALLCALGLAMAAPALGSLLWLTLDFLLNTGAALGDPGWWRDRLSLGIAAGLVGLAAWLGGWSVLERAAVAAPQSERASEARRRLLGGVVLVSALAAVGFTIALLWLALQTLLGARLDATQVTSMLKYLSAALIGLALVAYHGLILRADRAFGPAVAARVRIVALIAPGAEAALETLRQQSGRPILVAGRLAPDGTAAQVDLPTLEQLLAGLGSGGDSQSDSALLLLRPDGGSLHCYTRLRHSIG